MMANACARLLFLCSATAVLVAAPTAQAAARFAPAAPREIKQTAHDLSPTLRSLAAASAASTRPAHNRPFLIEVQPDRRGPEHRGSGRGVDRALQSAVSINALTPAGSFEGMSNNDNFNLYGGRVNPPDPVGAVGPNHYVQAINLAVSVYSKNGTQLLGPIDLGSLWDNFAVPQCAYDFAGDPVVVYDQLADRWIISQFSDPTDTQYWECIAISQTGDPTGAYYRYAFSTGVNFPDYPKLGLWTDSYVLTTREFGPTTEYGIGVYALEKNKMINGQPARAVGFFLDGNDPSILPLVGDGLLPAYIDGKQKPLNASAIPIVGTQDDGGPYGATFDAINIFDLSVKWRSTPIASLTLNTQLPVASFDSIFPCAPTSRDCLPQPGISDPNQFLDILSYRQRPTHRLTYRNMKTYDALVTNQSVEALPGVAGVRWYEIRRAGSTYSVFQQGTFAPNDGVHRWMGSAAMDRKGNIAIGYSVVNATTVFPGIRYTGRLAGDPAGQMTQGEGTIINGSGVQTTTNSRWGDYTSLNLDPVDDCTFWYVNEYYTAAGQATSAAGWQTRIASFRLPGCGAP
jgi:hypothetical protein